MKYCRRLWANLLGSMFLSITAARTVKIVYCEASGTRTSDVKVTTETWATLMLARVT